MGDAPRAVKIRHIGNCLKADPAYGEGVAKALGIPLSEVPESGKLEETKSDIDFLSREAATAS
jgi:hypothetical protein